MKTSSKLLKFCLFLSTLFSFISVPLTPSVYAAESSITAVNKDENAIDFIP